MRQLGLVMPQSENDFASDHELSDPGEFAQHVMPLVKAFRSDHRIIIESPSKPLSSYILEFSQSMPKEQLKMGVDHTESITTTPFEPDEINVCMKFQCHPQHGCYSSLGFNVYPGGMFTDNEDIYKTPYRNSLRRMRERGVSFGIVSHKNTRRSFHNCTVADLRKDDNITVEEFHRRLASTRFYVHAPETRGVITKGFIEALAIGSVIVCDSSIEQLVLPWDICIGQYEISFMCDNSRQVSLHISKSVFDLKGERRIEDKMTTNAQQFFDKSFHPVSIKDWYLKKLDDHWKTSWSKGMPIL